MRLVSQSVCVALVFGFCQTAFAWNFKEIRIPSQQKTYTRIFDITKLKAGQPPDSATPLGTRTDERVLTHDGYVFKQTEANADASQSMISSETTFPYENLQSNEQLLFGVSKGGSWKIGTMQMEWHSHQEYNAEGKLLSIRTLQSGDKTQHHYTISRDAKNRILKVLLLDDSQKVLETTDLSYDEQNGTYTSVASSGEKEVGIYDEKSGLSVYDFALSSVIPLGNDIWEKLERQCRDESGLLVCNEQRKKMNAKGEIQSEEKSVASYQLLRKIVKGRDSREFMVPVCLPIANKSDSLETHWDYDDNYKVRTHRVINTSSYIKTIAQHDEDGDFLGSDEHNSITGEKDFVTRTELRK